MATNLPAHLDRPISLPIMAGDATREVVSDTFMVTNSGAPISFQIHRVLKNDGYLYFLAKEIWPNETLFLQGSKGISYLATFEEAAILISKRAENLARLKV